MKRFLRASVVILIFALPPASVGFDLEPNFDATFSSTSPAEFAGTLSETATTPRDEQLFTTSGANGLLLMSKLADLSLLDVAMDAAAGSAADPGIMHPFSVQGVHDLELVSRVDSNHVVVLAVAQAPLTNVGPTRCLVHLPLPTGPTVPLLHVRCSFTPANVPANSTLAVGSGMLQVRFGDGPSRQVKEWKLGVVSLPAPDGGPSRLVQRTLRIGLHDVAHVLPVKDSYVEFDTPGLALQGQVLTPQASGTLRWDHDYQTGRLAPTRTSGSFAFTAQAHAPESPGTQIRGFAEARPVAKASTAPLSPVVALATTAAVLLVMATVLVARKASALLPLFTRVRPDQLLENARRKLVYDVVRENPGITQRGVARLAGLGRNSVRHHLNLLQRDGLVKNVAGGRTTSFFADPVSLSPEELELRRSVPNVVARRLVAYILANPRQTEKELAACVGASQQHISRLLRLLEKVGHIHIVREGGRRSYHLSVALRAVLHLQPSTLQPPLERRRRDANAGPAVGSG